MNENETGFTSFCCPECHADIEATLDLVGQSTECPACGAKIIVPADDGVARHSGDTIPGASEIAAKSRTIRIELDEM